MAAHHAPRPQGPISADTFVDEVLRTRFGAGFRRVPPFRMMFESASTVVYFQNFNKAADHLWYRVTENPWRILSDSRKESWVCLTNPAERFAYVLPVSAIKQRVAQARWSRPYLEINIDPGTSRWTEFDWRIAEYLQRF